jgi:polysaccharide export outer membrane protein
MLRVSFALCGVTLFVSACAGHWDEQGPHANGGSNPAAVPLAESHARPAASPAPVATAPVAPVTATPAPAAAVDPGYRINLEDKLKITVVGEPDLSAELLVDKAGVITGPLIGPIQVQGKTLGELERAYATRLREAEILRDPRVKAEVASFRPIYVLGQVKRPGRYAFAVGMTVRSAVALAEGYTTMGSESTVEITRGGAKLKLQVTPETQVLPGDEVRVPGMIF